MSCDLHIHSNLSDGCCQRSEIIQMARKRGLKAIAFTDHDAVDKNSPPILENDSLMIISGVELSVQFGKHDLHLLGYLINPADRGLQDYLRRFQEERVKRVDKIIAKLKHLNIDISPDRVFQLAGKGSVGRPHIAKAIVEQGYYHSMDDVFADLLRDHGPAWVEKHRLNIQEAIGLIHNAGGLAFAAHPGHDGTIDFLETFIEMGIDGIEVFHPKHSEENTQKLKEVAQQNNLLISGGSDFHGIGYGEENIGDFAVEDHYLEALIEAWKKKKGGY